MSRAFWLPFRALWRDLGSRAGLQSYAPKLDIGRPFAERPADLTEVFALPGSTASSACGDLGYLPAYGLHRRPTLEPEAAIRAEAHHAYGCTMLD